MHLNIGYEYYVLYNPNIFIEFNGDKRRSLVLPVYVTDAPCSGTLSHLA